MADREDVEVWLPCPAEKRSWLFSNSENEHNCIGHLRIDFGRSGTEFWTSWFDHNPELKTKMFIDELNFEVRMDRLPSNILANYKSMQKNCRHGLPVRDNEYGLYCRGKEFDYYLRCILRHGDYNAYMYCYRREQK